MIKDVMFMSFTGKFKHCYCSATATVSFKMPLMRIHYKRESFFQTVFLSKD